MEVTVKILADTEGEERVEVADEDTYEKVLEKLHINPVEVLVLRDGKPVPEDELVGEEKSARSAITILRIVSSG